MSDVTVLFLPRLGDCRQGSPIESGSGAPERTSTERTESSPMTTSQLKYADRRKSRRVSLQLRLAMVYPKHEGRPARPMFHGKTHDIGMSGLSLVVDYNVLDEGEVTVVLALPLAYAGAPRKVVTSTAEMTYAIHSSKLAAFKIGLVFREFRGNGKQLLEAALRHALIEEGDAGMQDTGIGTGANLPIDNQPLDWW
jgi:hypothetical protein